MCVCVWRGVEGGRDDAEKRRAPAAGCRLCCSAEPVQQQLIEPLGRGACLPTSLPSPCCRMADAIVINKANTAPAGSVQKLKEAAKRINPHATVRAFVRLRLTAAAADQPSSRHQQPWQLAARRSAATYAAQSRAAAPGCEQHPSASGGEGGCSRPVFAPSAMGTPFNRRVDCLPACLPAGVRDHLGHCGGPRLIDCLPAAVFLPA